MPRASARIRSIRDLEKERVDGYESPMDPYPLGDTSTSVPAETKKLDMQPNGCIY